jgi:hypothetical protein
MKRKMLGEIWKSKVYLVTVFVLFLYLGVLRNCNKKQYYNSFESKKFVW